MEDNKYKKYLKSKEWFEIKIELINSRGSKCEKCGKPKRATWLQVHHLTYDRLFNEEPEDLMLVCGSCHMIIHCLKKEKLKKPFVKRKKKKVPFEKRIRKSIDRIKRRHQRGFYSSQASYDKALSTQVKKLRGWK